MVKYKPERDLPQFAREAKTLSPSKLAAIVLNKRNKEITAESVTMWFKRHPQVFEELSKEIVQGLPTEKQAIDASMFQNGTFEEIPSVKNWILYMRSRRHKGKPLHPDYIKQHQVGVLKFLCKKYEKHPDRLSFQDAQEIFMAIENDPEASHWENGVKVKGGDSYHARRVLKDFLKSKGAADWEKIGVGKPSGFAHYKTLFVEKPVLMKMFEWIKAHDFKVYVVDKVMYHNGLRLSAVLNAKIEDFKIDDEWCELTVLEKFREVKTFMLVREVAELIKQVIGDRKEGKIFDGVLPTQVNSLNREALKQFAPDLEPKIEMPSHFFRHMCAQHLLRATDWNSKVVAAIMQCTEQSLNESYGGAPTGEFKKWCAKYLPELSMRMTT